MTGERRKGERRKAPAYQHYAKDWLVDTAHLTLEEQGAYTRFLDHQWVRAKPLPRLEADRAGLLGCTVEVYQRLWPRLRRFFPGGLNPRLEEIRQEQIAFHDRKVAGGLASAAARAKQEANRTAAQPQQEGHQEVNPSSASASSPSPALTKSTALVARGATNKLSVPEIVTQLQDTALQARRRETAGARREMFAEIVFAYWATKLGHTRTFIDPKRRATLRSRLVENGDDLSELLYVVDGALRDDWTMGRDARSTKRFDGIETIYQDRAHVEKFAGMSAAFKKGEPHPMATKYGEAA